MHLIREVVHILSLYRPTEMIKHSNGKWNELDFRERKPDSLHLGGSPRRATTCNPYLSNTKNPYKKNKTDRVQHLFITLIRVHLFGTWRVHVHQDWIKHKENISQRLHTSAGNSISTGISSIGRDLVLPSVVVEVVVQLCVRDTRIYPISG
jgi:hypothetical protein